MNSELIKTVNNCVSSVTHKYESVSQKTVRISDNAVSVEISSQNNIRCINFGKNIKSIHEGQFKGNRYIQKLTGGNGLNEIGESAFEGCSYLSSAEIFGGNGIYNVGNRAFKNSGLKSVTFGMSDESEYKNIIGEEVFSGCTELEQVVVNAASTSKDMFSYCTKLKNVFFDNSLYNISDSTFKGCTSIESISINSKLQKIEQCAFYGCSNLKRLQMSEISELGTHKSLDNDVFAGTRIESLTFPASLTSTNCISENSLRDMSNLKTIRFNGIQMSDLSSGIEFINSGIEPNVWLFQKQQTISRYRIKKNYKLVSLEYLKDATLSAINQNVPAVIMGLPYSGTTNQIGSMVRTVMKDDFVQWMNSLQKKMLFTSYDGTNSGYGEWLKNNIIKGYKYKGKKISHYTFNDSKDNINNYHILVIYRDFACSIEGFRQSDGYMKVPINDGTGQFSQGYHNKVPILNVFTDYLMKNELSSYQGTSFGGSYTKTVDNDIYKTHCFGLNHDATIYSSDGQILEYKD